MYKIFHIKHIWMVYSGYLTFGDWTKDKLQFSSQNISDCYAWIKAKEEGLIGE